jgi:hypothetical protein
MLLDSLPSPLPIVTVRLSGAGARADTRESLTVADLVSLLAKIPRPRQIEHLVA